MAFSEQFIDSEQALAEFKRILTGLPGYERLEDSQVVEAMSLFQSWALRQANWRAERAYQEAFLTTATNRASVLAHAEGRQYVPRKPTPSRGQAVLINSGDQPVSFPAGTRWVGSNQLSYQSLDDAVAPAGGTVTIEIRQTEPERLRFELEDRGPFTEVVIDREASLQVAELSVRVDGALWEYRPRLMNTQGSTRAYDEFYTALDEIGIRFGNGIFGAMPPDGADVVVEALMTQGQTELLPGQELRYLDGSEDHNVGMIEARTLTTITGGRPREDIEEVRRNALYYPLYDEQLVWRNDYAFAIRRQWPEVVWVNVWGEQEQEAVHGMSLDHIGKIYVSAYAPERPDVLTEITAGLEEPISREYEAVAPSFKPFQLRLTGTIERSIPLAGALNDVRTVLLDAYGRDSRNRRTNVKIKDFYKLITATGHFEMGDFTIELFGDFTSNGLNDLVHLDWDLSAINVGYE